ncbi:hypothetical protein [Ferrimonas senticii]|uniref:hypothetical protein n=1 Tax=Ferrimonas senticii TaxID=394566 RepID=UPI0003FFFF18|nr:hypothetical protein [Ferrimonas senticii]
MQNSARLAQIISAQIVPAVLIAGVAAGVFSSTLALQAATAPIQPGGIIYGSAGSVILQLSQQQQLLAVQRFEITPTPQPFKFDYQVSDLAQVQITVNQQPQQQQCQVFQQSPATDLGAVVQVVCNGVQRSSGLLPLYF